MANEMMNPDGVKKENIIGRVMVSKDLVGYQDGAVVSRTLVSKSVGTVTVFAFDQGQGLSEHTTPYDAMVEILDGEAEITIAGKMQLVKAGEMLIMPANQPHALHGVKAFKMMLIMIRA
ncbi:MAG: cupin domain-containing protein [Methanomassiliicoccales archaeon]|nr:cupin domain-containing protein [Methanomassiliicoccales archaeon]